MIKIIFNLYLDTLDPGMVQCQNPQTSDDILACQLPCGLYWNFFISRFL